ncbi:hypothetical protein ACFLTY_02050 [Chloroflexota bacterium]
MLKPKPPQTSLRLSKARKLYILAAIGMPVAVAAVVLAWAGGYLRNAVLWGASSSAWSVGALIMAWKLSRRRKSHKTHHAAKRTTRRRHMIVLERTFWLLMLAGGATGLAKALISDAPLHLVLEAMWLMIIGGGHFFFVSIMTDE